MSEAWIVDALRTPRGKGRESGALHHLHPQRLLGGVLLQVADRSALDPLDVDDVVMGCSLTQGTHDHNVARMAVLDAGWPVSIPGVTMNRFCGSGQQAVNFAAASVAAGHYQCVIAGGVEMMSHYPKSGGLTLDGGNEDLRERYAIVPQGISAELIATLEGFAREECDEFAAESQRRASIAIDEGRFNKSMLPVMAKDGSILLDREEHPRPDTTPASLSQLKPAFADFGRTQIEGYDRSFEQMCVDSYPEIDHLEYVHHGGNSSGVVDGAAAMLICSPDYAKEHGLKPRARVVTGTAVGSDPTLMLTAPAAAARKCVALAGKQMQDIDLWEVNEAFAAVVLKFIKDTEVDPGIINVNGGAIALGHPIGATGPMLIMTALDELERQDLSSAVVAMCTGGGMGTATLIERL